LLISATRQGALTEADAKFSVRTEGLRAALQKLSEDKSRPNNALQAETNLLLMRLHECVGDADTVDPILTDLREVIAKAEDLGDYPVESLAGIVQIFGDVFIDSNTYDELFDATVIMMERRSGEGTAGGRLLERGFQLLDKDRPYEAIRVLGRAQRKLVKREYRHDFVMALAACGSAYKEVDLLWAARSNFLAAATTAFADFTDHGDITRPTLITVRELAWIELQLGRVPAALQWAQLTDIVAHHLMLEGDQKEDFLSHRHVFDIILGIFFFRSRESKIDFCATNYLRTS
jgi:hypothetical protein